MAKAQPVELDPEMTFADAAAVTVATRSHELFAHAGHVLDTSDIERVHDMRVASRRLRAALEVFAPCFDKQEHRDLLREVKQLADALGARRDPDVQIAALQELRTELPAEDHPGIDLLIERERAAQAEGNIVLREALEAALTHDLRGRLEELARL
jgi:CHAD domain-containing protein